MPGAFDQFVNQRTVLLTTYRRDGTPVGTPVNIVVAGDRAFVRTFDTAWKLKRIRNNPTVGIAPSTVRGKPTGPTIGARARVLDGRNKTGSENNFIFTTGNKRQAAFVVLATRYEVERRVGPK